MKNKEIRELTDEILMERIKQEKQMLAKLKFSHAISPIENPMRIRHSRKFIARLLTELSRRKQKNTKNGK
jgi:large subunit ribosomal protein L29